MFVQYAEAETNTESLIHTQMKRKTEEERAFASL